MSSFNFDYSIFDEKKEGAVEPSTAEKYFPSIYRLFDEDSIIYNDDIEIIGEEKLNSSPVMRMNINSSMVGSLASELENIHNTLKDVPDMKSKQLDLHGYSDRFGNEPTLKEDVYSALMRVREMEDIVRPLSHKYYFPNGEDDYSDEHKAIVEIVKKILSMIKKN